MVGLAIAFPLSIGIALVEGTVVSYMMQPAGNASLLFAGVGMALLAVILIGLGYAARGIPGAVPTRKGIIVCLISGVLMGMGAVPAPFVTRAMTQGDTAASRHTPAQSS